MSNHSRSIIRVRWSLSFAPRPNRNQSALEDPQAKPSQRRRRFAVNLRSIKHQWCTNQTIHRVFFSLLHSRVFHAWLALFFPAPPSSRQAFPPSQAFRCTEPFSLSKALPRPSRIPQQTMIHQKAKFFFRITTVSSFDFLCRKGWSLGVFFLHVGGILRRWWQIFFPRLVKCCVG